MTNSKFRVLLYSDGSAQSFSAAVYTATLLKNMPNMSLTILQVEEGTEASPGTEYSWLDNWPANPTAGWMERVIAESDATTRKQYTEILGKTKAIFSDKGFDVNHQSIYAGTSINETVDAILDFATKNKTEVIVMGTRGLTALKGLMFGSLAHNMLNKSGIPVLLIKKLPQEFVDQL